MVPFSRPVDLMAPVAYVMMYKLLMECLQHAVSKFTFYSVHHGSLSTETMPDLARQVIERLLLLHFEIAAYT